mmetsp:Transcript_42097/g.105933  ORF Transcript_42097/g.105933 Transcript_42097/m.105933 type:complete len:183 (+) Transcript_42097:1302-1850(+)
MNIRCREHSAGGRDAVLQGSVWMVEEGCNCHYRRGDVSLSPLTFPPWMHEILKACMLGIGLPDPETWPNCCSVAAYAQGSDCTDWHADDQLLFPASPTNFRSSSLWLWLGETRTLELRPKAKGEESLDGQVELVGGDIYTMEGSVQSHFLHRVPRAEFAGLSVCLIWRWIVAHDPEHCICEL